MLYISCCTSIVQVNLSELSNINMKATFCQYLHYKILALRLLLNGFGPALSETQVTYFSGRTHIRKTGLRKHAYQRGNIQQFGMDFDFDHI